MELKKRVDFRKVAIILYFLLFVAYLIVGLTPAGATNYQISGEIEIPSIGLKSDITSLEIDNHKLDTPDTIVGSFSWSKNKTLLIGHNTTVFGDLENVEIGESVFYNQTEYIITEMATLEKQDISMEELLSEADRDTIVIMTCAGELLDGGDATQRLIVTAVTSML